MIQVLHTKKAYGPDLGDLLQLHEYIAGVVGPKDILKQQIHLKRLGCDPWRVLQKLNVDCEDLKQKSVYEDYMIEGNKYYWFLPHILESDDVSKYKNDIPESLFGYATDSTFFSIDFNECEVSIIDQVLLGHGYTLCTLPSDGSPELEWMYVELSNGDRIIGPGWMWYNK